MVHQRIGDLMSWPDIYAPDFPIRVALGKVPGWSRVTALGHLPAVNSNTVPEDIWTLGGNYPWLSAATLVKIRSTSIDDAPGGAGCQSARVNALEDGTYLEKPVTVTLNGTSDVLLAAPIGACNGLLGMLPGVANAFCTTVGDITLRRQDNDEVLAVIPAGKGISQQSQFTVPAGKTLVIMGLEAALTALSGLTDRVVDVDTFFQAPGQIYRLPRRIQATDRGPTNLEPRTGIVVPEKNRFQLRCTAVSSSQDTSVNGAFEAFLVTN
jgi:hypothetical protein